jgi:hypothetical protein
MDATGKLIGKLLGNAALSRAMVEVRCYACRGSGLQRDCYEHPC